MTQKTRTRFAPSPTGFIHLGNIRSALYPWAFARSTGGDFILRIEDTDLERSTQAAVDVIIESMSWLGLDYDEGPFYQMLRMDRYKAVLADMVAAGHVYPCYMSMAELDALRERQTAAKEKPRYDGTWRPAPGKSLPSVPEGVQPVLRFKNPQGGSVVWDDKVKGRIEISNDELDDLVIARPDGTPTYNFCVVVDDLDMAITHVIRGDDHVNNTPRQINIFKALGKEPPVYAHLPTVLNEQGEKMSKRNGAKAVTQYREEGYLPDAMVNYLARLGWSHGDDEIFSRAQFLEWFNLDHLGKSAAQFDEAKLRWVNAQHIKITADEVLAPLVQVQLHKRGIAADERLPRICALFKDRCDTTVALADWAAVFYADVQPAAADLTQHVTEAIKPALALLADKLAACTWDKAVIAAAIKEVLTACSLKMPHLAMPVRVLVVGNAHTPSLDAVLELFDREKVISRLKQA
ncbi:glutamate--tRNA ligase [Rhodoferax sp.]|uniref:glutamate--tRNA ligase n=1 Tax=Rhodoferax sp. TaxID=50421 RepID=UPI0026170ED8|nr:glutamate--tRNA ligase [Rhodoferax sp.]MDD2917710.1 glutamate--tRNA ligase [Rhodoferax sp.]